MSKIPVLILAYRRLDALKLVIGALENQENAEIYVSSDAPRVMDGIEVNEVRDYLQSMLEIGVIKHLNLRNKNSGIAAGVTEGIDWMFKYEKYGVIIEDDIVLTTGALSTVIDLIPVLLENDNIFSINLRNEVPENRISHPSQLARTSALVSSHGWVTSAAKWNKFRSESESLTLPQILKGIPIEFGFFQRRAFIENLKRNQRLERKLKQSWDLKWQAFVFANNGRTIQINRNFVKYMGYDQYSTHHTVQARTKDLIEPNKKEALKQGIDDWDILADIYRFKIGMRHTIPRFIVRKFKLNYIFKNFWNW